MKTVNGSSAVPCFRSNTTNGVDYAAYPSAFSSHGNVFSFDALPDYFKEANVEIASFRPESHP